MHGIVLKRFSQVRPDEFVFKKSEVKWKWMYIVIHKEKIDKHIKRQEEILHRSKEAYLAGIDSIEEYKENKEKIKQVLIELKKEIIPLSTVDDDQKNKRRDELRKKLKTAVDIMNSDKVTEEEKNTLLRSFISKITFDNKTKMLTVFYFA